MNIIIAGAGKVGFNLSKSLCIGHNVIVIDKNSEALHRLSENLDILTLIGAVENPETYQHILNKKIDLFIAVTNIDNVNLIATVIADSVLDIDRKFVRLQQQFFNADDIKKRLDIDRVIFPLKLASQAIASLLNYPKANNVKFFKYTDYRLISVRISPHILPQEILSDRFVLVGIERNKDFFIMQADTQMLPNDLLYLFGRDEDIHHICSKLELKHNNHLNKCVIFGAQELGLAIAKELVHINKEVKVIEKDISLCYKADEALKGEALVINSKYGTSDIFDNEELDNADVFIASTENDEYNMIKCLEAQERGINKVIAISNEMEYYNLMHSLGIIVLRGPKISTYNTIMEHINSSGVVIQKSFCGAKAVVFMRKIFPNSRLIGRKIKPIILSQGNIFYMRNETLSPFQTKTILDEGDLIIVFCTVSQSEKVKNWIYEL